MPLTPYDGIHTARRKWLSVAPVDIVGTTEMSPNIVRVISVVADSSVGSTGRVDFGKSGSVACVLVILMPVSATTRVNAARTSAELDVGTMRQFTFAVAFWGSALYA